jgi:hypothetical protein
VNTVLNLTDSHHENNCFGVYLPLTATFTTSFILNCGCRALLIDIQFSITFLYNATKCKGHAVAYWLRHYVIIRKVSGSRLFEVNEFFQFT